MTEFKCVECGQILTDGVTECPKCGCPVELAIEGGIRNNAPSKKMLRITKRSIILFVSLILGVVIIILGFNVMSKKTELSTYNANNYSVDYSEFGGDFYTAIYGASDTIVDELNDINGAMESASKSINTATDAIYFSAGMIIIAIGLAVISVCCVCFYKEK